MSGRIQLLIEDLGLNNNQFSKKIGLGNNVTIGRIINETRKPSFEVLEKILQTFGNVSADWLMKGEGNMYTDNVHSYVHPYQKGEAKGGALRGASNKPNIKSVPYIPDGNGEGIPYYEIEASAGPIEMFADSPEIPALKLVIPGFEDCDLALNVWGMSMSPVYDPGDVVICKRINDQRYILYGEVYLVITAEFRTIKYLRRGSKDQLIKLVSHNPEFDPMEIERDGILHLYLVKGKVKRNAI